MASTERQTGLTMSTMESLLPSRICHLAKQELGKLLNPASNADWRILAGQLGFSDLDIQGFEARNGANPDYNPTLVLLRHWETRFNDHPSVDELLEALRRMGREDARGIILQRLRSGNLFDSVNRPSPPPGNSLQPSFPPPPVIPGFHPEADVFRSDLQPIKDNPREPTENSYSSLNSMNLPPPSVNNQSVISNHQELTSNPPDVRPKIRPPNNDNDMRGYHDGPPPLPSNFTANVFASKQKPQRKAVSDQMSQKGTSERPQRLLPGARPKVGSEEGSRKRSSEEPFNMKRTHSMENTSSTSSSSSSSSSGNSNTWPSGKENPIKNNGNPLRPKEPSTDTSHQPPLQERIPGDYQSVPERLFKSVTCNSWPLDNHQGLENRWLSDGARDSHRQVISDHGNSLSQISRGVTPAPSTCRTGIAYGITFAWKDWKCGMDLAKKLKSKGHHVEVDRKREWYQDVRERNRKLTNVFNSCKYIIVIYTPNYEREIRGEITSPINARFLFEYMTKEYTRNNNTNTRFIPIVDVSRITCAERIFQSYPVEQYRYIVRVIRQQGVIVERQYSLN